MSTHIFPLSRGVLTCLGAALVLGLAACSSAQNEPTSAPLASKSFVLVHGAWQGAWAWDDEAAKLRAKGANVTVVELPGHGADTTPAPQDTLDAYVATTTAAIDAAPTNVVLVGHSISGAVITGAVEARASRIDKLVYLAAYVLQDGQAVFDLANTDGDSHLGKVLAINKQTGLASLPTDQLGDIFCADCSADRVNDLIAHYHDEPVAPFVTPVHPTAANWGHASKFYVFTTNDHAVSPALQQKMAAGVSWTGTATLDTSHSPFLSATDALADVLADLARQ